jgi:hypothetical protein
MPIGLTGRRREGPDEGWVRAAATVQVARRRTGIARITVRLLAARSNRYANPDRLIVTLGGYSASCSLGLHRCSGRVVAGRLAQPSLACTDSPRLLPCQHPAPAAPSEASLQVKAPELVNLHAALKQRRVRC